MGEIVITVVKWVARVSFWSMVVVSWLGIVGFTLDLLLTPGMNNIINDVFALVNVWSPFYIHSIVSWVIVAPTTYLTYRTAMKSYNLLNSFIG